MPGYTQRFALPYMLNTEGLHTIAHVTKLLAEKLAAIIDSGELKGPKGDPGERGLKGDPGERGLQGLAGERGPAGLDGRDGLDGQDGAGLVLADPVPTSAALPATGTTGEMRIALDTGHGWQWSGTQWVDIGPLQGPPGADGRDGVDGDPGPANPDLVQGAGLTLAVGTTPPPAGTPLTTITVRRAS